MEATLPGATVAPWRWQPSLPDVDRQWEADTVNDEKAVSTTLTPERRRALTVRVGGGDEMRGILARWNPTLERRVLIESVGDDIRIEAPTVHDLAFIQELLTLGTPDDPDLGAAPTPSTGLGEPLAGFIGAFLAEVRDGRLTDDESAATRWVEGMRALRDAGVEELEDTVVREQIIAVLSQPLAAAGLHAERIVLAD
jgi:hypothetical protein